MGGLVEAASGVADRRLLTTTFLPVLLFLGALAAVAVAGVGPAAATRWWSALGTQVQVTASGLVLAATLLLSQLIALHRVGLIRIYEGYWDALPYGRRLAERCRLRFTAADDQRWYLYPADEARLMPTMLGNILRGAEDHSRERYAIDGVTAWPRLYPALPDTFRQVFASASADLDLMITVSGLGLAFSLLGGALGAFLLPWYSALLCCWIGLFTAWWGYRGAVRAAEPYGELFRAAFDVHRWTLLDTMGLRRPTEYRAEAEQWRQLDKLWTAGAPDSDHAASLGFPTPTTGEPAPAQAKPPASGRPALVAGEPDSGTGETVPEAVPAVTSAGEPVAAAGTPALDGSQMRSLRLAPWLVAAAAMLGLLVVAGNLVIRTVTSPAHPRAVRALAPYRVLTAADVEGPSAADAVGRYPLRNVAEDAPLGPDVLGPRLPPGAADGRAVVSLRPKPGRLFADAAARGTTAALRLVPTATSRGRTGTPLILPEVTVLDLPGDGRTGLVVAVPAERLTALLGALADSDVYLVTTLR
ncbi:hypothetical protein Sme01_19500 [Sphaerisporangium melleum]|uniref:Uncharacterized protein n=1 Tax=Sphaerisporangium melleum TaxID=321316 RepID=A0A917RDF4_9ACTN|nr:hypothetical protein [Sphaerisporangium melleum]GGL02847.1 hypothetical protein GCM10007964_51140 [Sphaerisporangium melleum]GII69474.1 hypothetical protein Sme01_19500 [Sphaerisporangium melleum]